VRAALEAVQADGQWPDEAVEAAQRDFRALAEAEWRSIEQAQARLAQAERSTLEAQAGRLLLDAALVELALGQQPDLFGQEAYPAAFDESAVVGLKRHGYPWGTLLKLVRSRIQAPRPTDPFFVEIQGEAAEWLRRRFGTLEQRAGQLVERIAGGRR